MFSRNDIEHKSIFVVNCLEKRNLRVSCGSLLLENDSTKKTLTKLPFQKILVLFVIGHVTITTPLIDKCRKYSIPLVVMKPNLRPVFFFSSAAEANFLLRQKQYTMGTESLNIAKGIIFNKISNQLKLIENTRVKDLKPTTAKKAINDCLYKVESIQAFEGLLSIEGYASKMFFQCYFEKQGWLQRLPRTKIDPLNTTLDIGYTLLFNYIEAFTRLFGFDPYIGVYHKLWFNRKSLICDLMEPFRCLIEAQVRKGFNKKQFKVEDFDFFKNQYFLKPEKSSDYHKVFFETLIKEKAGVFNYMLNYYRCFMGRKGTPDFPMFLI